MTYEELTRYADIVTADTWKRLRMFGRPAKVAGREPMRDLYELSFGELIQSQEMAKANDITGLCVLLLGMTVEEVNKADGAEVMSFVYWASRELEKIGKLFADLNVEPTSEQQQAGIKQLNHGLFGTLDWYCRRMGITDHAEAEAMPWVRFYKCMKIDNENFRYEQRLRKVYEQQRQQRRR